MARARSDKSLARFDLIALVLSGGGALGAYQAGAYAALENCGVRPNWIAGTAIGAVTPRSSPATCRTSDFSGSPFWQALSSGVWTQRARAPRQTASLAAVCPGRLPAGDSVEGVVRDWSAIRPGELRLRGGGRFRGSIRPVDHSRRGQPGTEWRLISTTTATSWVPNTCWPARRCRGRHPLIDKSARGGSAVRSPCSTRCVRADTRCAWW